MRSGDVRVGDLDEDQESADEGVGNSDEDQGSDDKEDEEDVEDVSEEEEEAADNAVEKNGKKKAEKIKLPHSPLVTEWIVPLIKLVITVKPNLSNQDLQ